MHVAFLFTSIGFLTISNSWRISRTHLQTNLILIYDVDFINGNVKHQYLFGSRLCRCLQDNECRKYFVFSLLIFSFCLSTDMGIYILSVCKHVA